MALLRLSKHLIVFVLGCYCFLPLTAVAQEINFRGQEFHEAVDVEYWKSHPRDGVEVIPFLRKGKVIFRHPISFMGTRFYSLADFNYAQFNSAAKFINVQFDLAAGFYRARFNSKVDYSLAHFHSTVDFNYAQFNSAVVFTKARFDSTALFRFVQIDSTADFYGAQFHSVADFFGARIFSTTEFEYARFDSAAVFSRARFNSTADFFKVQFHSAADFSGAMFHSSTDFSRAQFDSEADFSSALFYSKASFNNALFASTADFRESRFAGRISFKYAILPDSLDFRDVIDIVKEIDFTTAYPPSESVKCRIALSGTDIDKIKINMRLFELWFPADTNFKDSLAVDDTIKVVDQIYGASFDEKTSIYESVLKKLKDDGFMDSYRILDIDYREFKYRHGGGLNWYVANTFDRLWWNYGYAKELIFLWTIGFLFLFSVLNINFYRRLSENVYAIPFLGKWEYGSMRWPKRWIYYWLHVVTYTSIIFFGLKMDIAKFKQGVVRSHPFLFAYLMFIYVLGLICLGFIVNIIFTR